MKLLLDTHAFIWWDSPPERLSETARAALEDPSHTLLLSVDSPWEMQIKHQLGKLDLHVPLEKIIREQQEHNGINILNVTLEHVLALSALPIPHNDPFDRLLIAQANAEGALLVSKDARFDAYPVRLLW